ncbi:glycosyltransferase family 4 protein [Oleidesulfovibrio alaskensis]|jgi:glycosyltransferase involved in cell wall biosynthesis|uniref:glycosyltransferase family 4 protein n=1 Tax=Oleidesulfovibrio alaskensis TaxID=58180 RepID=UPI001A4C5997|nr:glycosyltransferase family 4 protein [Oleidesulfovibrio alaskensis]MBL3581376.1 glycosyltransferase family 4 protein [Oleidesulfovibrio alaskensis]
MSLYFCTPFKPPDHPRPSGDVTIAQDLCAFMRQQGQHVETVPYLPTDRIWRRPAMWPRLAWRRAALGLSLCRRRPGAWFTYHSYWRAPDLLGPAAAAHGVPYFIFAGAHSPKRAHDRASRWGHDKNLAALRAAAQIFVNKHRDLPALRSVLPESRLSFIAPGIRPDDFAFDRSSREELRRQWRVSTASVVLSVAMLRKGVKTEGIKQVISVCARLRARGEDIILVVAGDGPEKEALERLAGYELAGNARFTGFVPREALYKYYSAADLFAFPGINEGLGMVYLEAQAAGLPVVAWDHDGAPELVKTGTTGIITPAWDTAAFAHAIGWLATDGRMRRTLGDNARNHVRAQHNLHTNYSRMLDIMNTLCGETRPDGTCTHPDFK